MRLSYLVVGAVIAQVAITCAATVAAPVHQFIIYNDAKLPVMGYQVRPVGASAWTDIILDPYISPGSSRTVQVPASLPCILDVKVVLTNQLNTTLPALDSCNVQGKWTANLAEAPKDPPPTRPAPVVPAVPATTP